MNTQCAQILAHLESGKTITPLEALQEYGCFRLGARIFDLKSEGHPIERDFVEVNGKRFAEYSLAATHECMKVGA